MADLPPQMPRAGVGYPKTFTQVQDWFGTDGDRFEYLAKLRWQEGLSHPPR